MSAVLSDSSAFPDPYSLALEDINLAQPELFQSQQHWAYFERLRKEAPVHYCKESLFGPFWSVTRFEDIMAVDTNPEVFSSQGGITLGPPVDQVERPEDFQTPMFIAMDAPKHDVQRATVSPVVAPRNLAVLESTIRERAGKILDSLPVGETFNWVDKVSIELTTQMLATLFDFPFEDRRKLTYWSDVATAAPGTIIESVTERREILLECLEYFTRLWNERVNAPPGNDLISMLAHGKDTRNMQPMEFLGNLILLIVGGNDTTRNSISGGLLALNENPAEYDKLRANTALIPNMVSEIIRWQTPLSYMSRTATQDTELQGQKIKQGDTVCMWYISGNRDETMIPDANQFLIDRPKARQHLSFGFGIHRCMGNRLAEMQLRVLWEEIMARFDKVRSLSVFIHGFTELPVRVHPKR